MERPFYREAFRSVIRRAICRVCGIEVTSGGGLGADMLCCSYDCPENFRCERDNQNTLYAKYERIDIFLEDEDYA